MGSIKKGDRRYDYEHVLRASYRKMTPAELSYKEDKHADVGPQHLTEDLAKEVAAGSRTELIDVYISLNEDPQGDLPTGLFQDSSVTSIDEANRIEGIRSDALEARKISTVNSQKSAKALIESLGGEIVASLWLTNGIEARVPASSVLSLSQHKDIKRIERNKVPSKQGWQGQDIWERDVDLGLRVDHYSSRGWDGDAGAKGLMKIAVIDFDFDDTHPAFKNSALGNCPGSASCRVVRKIDCFGTACADVSAFPRTDDHGTIVAALAAGDLNKGQDQS